MNLVFAFLYSVLLISKNVLGGIFKLFQIYMYIHFKTIINTGIRMKCNERKEVSLIYPGGEHKTLFD